MQIPESSPWIPRFYYAVLLQTLILLAHHSKHATALPMVNLLDGSDLAQASKSDIVYHNSKATSTITASTINDGFLHSSDSITASSLVSIPSLSPLPQTSTLVSKDIVHLQSGASKAIAALQNDPSLIPSAKAIEASLSAVDPLHRCSQTLSSVNPNKLSANVFAVAFDRQPSSRKPEQVTLADSSVGTTVFDHRTSSNPHQLRSPRFLRSNLGTPLSPDPLTHPQIRNSTPTFPTQCVQNLGWVVPNLHSRDCSAAGHILQQRFVHWGMTQFELLKSSTPPLTTKLPLYLPRRYAVGTCVIAIIMLNSVPRESLPDVPAEERFENNDLATWKDISDAAQTIQNTCLQSGRVRAGWERVGLLNSAAVLIVAKGSHMDRLIIRQTTLANQVGNSTVGSEKKGTNGTLEFLE